MPQDTYSGSVACYFESNLTLVRSPSWTTVRFLSSCHQIYDGQLSFFIQTQATNRHLPEAPTPPQRDPRPLH